MSKLQELFIQIFDRKDRIVDQMRQQVYSYTDSVSINFAAAGGGDPPHCLWNPGPAVASVAGVHGCAFPRGNTDSVRFSADPFSVGRGFVFDQPAFGRDFALRYSSLGGRGLTNSFGVEDASRFPVGKFTKDLILEEGVVLENPEQNVVSDVQVSNLQISNPEKLIHEKDVAGHYSASRRSKSNNPSCRVIKSRCSSVKLDSEKGSLLDCNVINFTGPVTRSRACSTELDRKKRPLKDVNNYIDRITRSRASSPKLDLENRSLRDSKLCQYTGHNTRSRASSTKLDCEKRHLKDVNNYIGQITRSRASSPKLDLENRSLRDSKLCQYTGHNKRSRASFVKFNFEKQPSKARNLEKDKYSGEEAENDSNEGNQDFSCNNIFRDVDIISSGFEHTQVSSSFEVSKGTVEHEIGSELPFPKINQKHSTAADTENQHVKVLSRSLPQQKNNAISSPTQHLESKDTFSFRSSTAQSKKPSTSECLKMVSTVKNVTPLRTSFCAKYSIEDGSTGQKVIPGGPCDPSRNAQLSTRSSTSNSNSVCGILPETQEAVVFNSSKDNLTKHAQQKTILIDATEADGLHSEGQYFLTSSTSNNKTEASVELNRILDTSCSRNKKDGIPDKSFGTSPRVRHKPILGSDECKHKRISADKSMPIVECHNFKLSNEVNHETSAISNQSHFRQRKLSVSEAVVQVEEKSEDILWGTTSTMLDLREQCASDAAPQEFPRHSLKLEYSGNSDSAEAVENEKLHIGLASSDCGYATLTGQAIIEMDGKEEEMNDIVDTHPSTDGADLPRQHTSNGKTTNFSLCDDNSTSIRRVLQPMEGKEENRMTAVRGNFHTSDLGVKGISTVTGTFHLSPEIEGFSIGSSSDKRDCNITTELCFSVPTLDYVNMPETGKSTELSPLSCLSPKVERFTSIISSDLGVQGISAVTGTFHLSPEIEGFSIGSSSDKRDCNITTDLCFSVPIFDYANMPETGKSVELTPLPSLSPKHKMHNVEDIFPSIPGDLLEDIYTTGYPNFNRVESRQPGASQLNIHCGAYESVARNGSLLGKSTSQQLSSAKFLFEYNIRRPSTPPFDKYSHSTSLIRSGSSSGKLANPELVCFRIDENASTTGEDDNDILDEIAQEKVSSSEIVVSENIKSGADIKLVGDAANVISTMKRCLDGGSLDSVSTKFCMGLQVTGNQNIEDRCRSSVRCSDKKSVKTSLSARRNNAMIELSPQKRSRKSKLSSKFRDQKKSTITTTKGKSSNIVANISSFIPLVQQKKQAAAIQTGKREIKVKALEAAEAAKKNEQKKQKEREMKKEATRLERVRLEQEKVKQLELELKKREDERKKKEAELEARKRQREEDEKKEKQRKRRCLEEKFRQRKQQDKMPAEVKEVLPTQSMKDIRPQILENVMESSETKNGEEVELKGNNNNTHEVSNFGVMDEEAPKRLTMKENLGSQSYEMSPYHDSDLEDDEDKIQGMKPIPLWARKESLSEILQSQRLLDAATIFGCKRSFDWNKVLSPRIRRRPFAQL